MADKPRTPDPPRKVQAPKVRHKTASSSSSEAVLPWTNILIGVVTVGIVGLLIALFVMLSGDKATAQNVTTSDISQVKSAMTAAGCTFESRPADKSNQHMSGPDEVVVYGTYPAASGKHRSDTAIWGNYRNPADPRQAVHNLEHGGIAIWYGSEISPDQRAALDAFYDEDPNGILVTPLEEPFPGVRYPDHDALGSKIALTVWTADDGKPDSGVVRIAVCPRVDETAFATFRDAFRGKGPERFPISQMLPGIN